MPLLKPQQPLRATRLLLARSSTTSTATVTSPTTPLSATPTSSATATSMSIANAAPHRPLSTSAPRSAAESSHHGEESHYDPPGGWLWGQPPGTKPQREGWETLTYYGLIGGLVAAGVAYAFKPDTSIQTWALEEARRRLEKEGIIADPDEGKA